MRVKRFMDRDPFKTLANPQTAVITHVAPRTSREGRDPVYEPFTAVRSLIIEAPSRIARSSASRGSYA